MGRDITVRFIGKPADLVAASEVSEGAVKRVGDAVEETDAKVVAAGGLAQLAKSLQGFASSLPGPLGSLGEMGPAGAIAAISLAAVGLAAGVALAPVVAFGVGLAGALSVMTLGLGIVGLLGAGVVLLASRVQGSVGASQNLAKAHSQLAAATAVHEAAARRLDEFQVAHQGQKLTAAQLMQEQDLRKNVADAANKQAQAEQAVAAATTATESPMARLTAHLGEMADRLGQQAVPIAARLLLLIDSFLPRVEKLASALISGLGDRLPGVLAVVIMFLNSLFGFFESLAPVVGRFFDAFLARAPALVGVFDIVNGVIGGALQGLLQNLLRLSDWFIKSLPTLGPIAAEVFGGLGALVMWLATAAFPAIVAAGIYLWGRINELIAIFRQFAPQIQAAASMFMGALRPALQAISQHSDLVHAALVGMAISIGTAIVVVAALAVVVGYLVAGIVVVYDWILKLAGQLFELEGGARGAQMALDSVRGAIEAIIGVAEGAAGAVGHLRDQVASIPLIGGALHVAGIPGFQHGGTAPPGSWFMTGEGGPELGYARPGGGVTIFPGRGTGAAAGPSKVINVSVVTSQPVDERRIADYLRQYELLHG
jgi:hypothetical protein